MHAQLLRLHHALRDWSFKYGKLVVPVALGILALGLIYWRIVRGYSPPVSYVPWPEPPGWVQQLYTIRWIVRAVLVVSGLGLAYVEWTAGAVSSLLQKALATRSSQILLIGLLAVIIGTYIFQPGNYVVDEHRPNVSAVWAVQETIKQGQWFVYWTTYVHMGGPFMQFHNSFCYYFAALISLIVPDFFDTAEISAYLLFIASGFTMYLFVRQLTTSKLGGLVAAIAYCGSYYRFEIMSFSANLPIDGMLFALWPLQFYLIERICSSPRTLERPESYLLAISAGAQLWNHPLHGAWMVGLGVLYAVIRVPYPSSLSWWQRSARLAGLIGAHVGGVFIGIYQILPILYESNLVPAQPQAKGVGLEYILDAKIATGWEGHYISASILICAVLGIALIIIMKQSQAYAIIVQALLPLLLAITPYYLPVIVDLLNSIPFGNLVYARSAHRYMYVAFGPLAALVGVFVHLAPSFWKKMTKSKLAQIFASWPLERLSILIAAIILIENVPLTMWYSYKSPDSYLNNTTGRWPIITTLAQTTEKTSRVFDATEGLTPSFLYPMLTGHPSLSGHGEDAPPSITTSRHFAKLITADIARGHISNDTANLLYQLNIGYLITNGVDLNLPELELVQRTDSATLWRVPSHSPITATTRPSSDNRVAVTVPAGGDVPVTVTRHIETATTVTLDFSLPERAFIQLAYSAYPYQKVLLNGLPVTVKPTPLGLIGFWAEPGTHTVQVLPELSPLRKITLAVSATSLLVAAALIVYPNRQR